MRFLIEKLLQFFLPPQCHCCEKFLEEGELGICSGCFSRIRWIEPPYCSVCGTPFPSQTASPHACSACLNRKKYFTIARALGCYEGSLQEAIHRWKYQGKSSFTSFFGRWMAEGFYRYWETVLFDLFIPVPLHPRRLRERGFNQALLLAKELSRHTGIPLDKRILRKSRPTLPQVSLNGHERERGIKGSFHIMGRKEVEGKSFLLVDDVYTTGATVSECAKVLLAGGAHRVDVFTLAHAVKSP